MDSSTPRSMSSLRSDRDYNYTAETTPAASAASSPRRVQQYSSYCSDAEDNSLYVLIIVMQFYSISCRTFVEVIGIVLPAADYSYAGQIARVATTRRTTSYGKFKNPGTTPASAKTAKGIVMRLCLSASGLPQAIGFIPYIYPPFCCPLYTSASG